MTNTQIMSTDIDLRKDGLSSMNVLQFMVRLFESVEGEPTPCAKVRFTTPEGGDIVLDWIRFMEFPEDTYSWLLTLRLIINTVIGDYETSHNIEETES